eukprot:CAMPEP_0195510036 /NCGR_PEP_ID=MMETSP0794_2-20130614/2800_1 /TAXON_ID=515487 /ORGANISM="Stephanopyxis turris, Strain CCMP 815" /LENGTH=245 /DNA_ID=CAMNT_0040637385 /DNA_START=38 /DNA_END=775 /DNA_ORIENTATION=-
MTGASWRDTLFVWDGIWFKEDAINNDKELEAMKGQKNTKKGAIVVKWNGTWVGCDNCPDAKAAKEPKRGAFDKNVSSKMHFDVKGTAVLVSGNTDDKSFYRLYCATMVDGEGWDMGEGSEKKKYKDHAHELLFNLPWSGDLRDKRKNLVFAVGKNEFGPFISAGWMRPGNRMTLGRRYVDEHDARAEWDIDELKKQVIDEICEEESNQVKIPPWQCDVLHSNVRGHKKRKVESSKAEEDTKPDTL